MRLSLVLILLYSLVVFVMIWSQDDIIFPVQAVGAPPPLPQGGERLQVKSADGNVLHGVHIPPADEGSRSRTLIIGFGGNAWNGEDVASYLHELYSDADIVAFHYRGYRPSTGKPSAEALLSDAPLVFDAAVEKVPAERKVAVGFSIGTGVAASLANRRPIDGMILVTPFDSLKKVASETYPWLPVGLFFEHEFDAAGALKGSEVRVAILAAANDEIIPTERTDSLRKQVRNLIFDRTIEGAGHNDIYARSEFQSAMDEALKAVLRR
jgi:pimeloyl-ACP methyl ester carboxylesterase